MHRRRFLGSSILAVAGAAACAGERPAATEAAEPGVMLEPPRRTPIVESCDVCVLGGSCTGVFAAVRAAQLGAKVAIVEKQNSFGGVATSSLVCVWHRLLDRNNQRTIIGGLTQAVLDRLAAIGAHADHGRHDHVLNTEELKIELDRLLLETGNVTPYLHTVYAATSVEGNSVDAVFIENKSGRQAIRAKVFVDATGDGDLAKDCGIPYHVREGLQPPTTCAKIHGLPPNIGTLLERHREEFALREDQGWGADLPGLPGARMYALTHVFGTDASDANQLTRAEIEGRRQVRAYMDIARKYGGGDSPPVLLDLPSRIGVRETRSFQAKYTLTEEDVMSCRRFPDAIANGSYHIDVHDPQTGVFKFKEPRGDFYQIPFSTMVSAQVGNLVMAGRMISADRGAFGGIRVMVNLNQVGEAAGVAAAIAARDGVPVADVDAEEVRGHLTRLGAVIL
jgi:hypothetical protein